MQSIRRSAGTLAVAVFFVLFVWLWEHWLDLNSAPLIIPLQAKMAFAVALALLGARFHLVAYCLRADTRKDWLQRAAVWGSLWYIWMALVTDTVLPGPDAWPHLIVSVGFGLFMGYRPPRQEIADLPIPSAIQPWLLIGLVTAIFALSLLSFTDQPG